MPIRLSLLGVPELRTENDDSVDFPLGKPLALLSYLVLEDREVRRDELAQLLWPDSVPDRARHSIRQAIWLIRRKLGEEVIEGDDPVRVSCNALSCDVKEFEAALKKGDLDGARALWRGPLLSRLSLSDCRGWEHWREEQRELVQRGFFEALVDRSRAMVGEGRGEEVLPYLAEAVVLNPYSLGVRVLQVETLLELRQVAAARQALEEARREVGDGEGVEGELDRLEDRLRVVQARSSAEMPDRMGESVEFVGRAGELSDLRGLWKRVKSGRSGVACVVGATGIGKTRLAAEFLAVVEEGGGLVSRAKGYRGEHRIPWGTVADLVRQLMSMPGARGISSGSESVLRAVLPSLSGSGNGKGHVEGNGNGVGEVSPAAMADAVLDLVEAVAFEESLSVFIDDWQWVDKESRALLGKVMRGARGLSCLFLLAERTGERRLGQEGAESVTGELGGRRIVLSPLSEGELGELLGLLAEFTDPDGVDEMVGRIHGVTGGNPLFVGEILRKLAEEGVYRWEGGHWVLAVEGVPEELDLPESIQELIRERLGRLSPTAAQVAAALAGERRSVPVGMLRRRAGVDEAVFTRAIGELLDREVVEWVGAKELDFTHDQLREAVGVFYQPSRVERLGRWVRERPTMAAATVLGTAAIMILAILGSIYVLPGLLGAGGEEAATYPYGRGSFVIYELDSVWALIPPSREGGEWTRGGPFPGVPILPEETLRAVERALDGSLRLFGEHRPPDITPLVAEFHPDGGHQVLFQTLGDDGFKDYLPGAEEILIITENLATQDTYDIDLLSFSLATGETERLYRGREQISYAQWSPDGTRIALVLYSAIDTLALMTSSGSLIGRYPFDGYRSIRSLSWCQDNRNVVLTVETEDDRFGVLFDLEDQSVMEFGRDLRSFRDPICLGEGREALVFGWGGQGGALFLVDLRTGELSEISGTHVNYLRKLFWVPDQVEVPMRGIAITEAPDRIPWGRREHLEAMGVGTDGSFLEFTPTWESSDTGVISVSPTGEITGNRAGEAWVFAGFREYLRDSVRIQVEETGYSGEELLFRDPFSDEALPGWVLYGEPVPSVIASEGERVLSLNGDGSHRDGLILAEGFSMAQGATLEFEFKLPLHRADRQRVGVCLFEDSPSSSLGPTAPLRPPNRLCLIYPSAEQSKFRSDLAKVWSGPRSENPERAVSPTLPSDDWVHLALQIRADGETSILLERSLWVPTDGRVTIDPDKLWKIDFHGPSVDTQLLIRNVTVWRGERYSLPTPPTPPRTP